jgi:ubiquinol-cytochrome c reductase cytochrome b subunit
VTDATRGGAAGGSRSERERASVSPPGGEEPPFQDRIGAWLDERLHLSRFARQALDKVFPDHWSFMFGEIALYSFVVLVLTGVFLAFFFEPSSTPTTYEGPYEPLRGLEMSDAYASTLRLSFEVRAGLVMRQTHHWAALVFIGSIVVHLCRVFFTGAFRKPREINWVIGVTMLLLALLNGFTGYSLPDDLLSGTGLRIMYSVILSVPLVGSWVAFLLFGGEFPAEQILGRLFVLHIFLVPVLLGALLGAHLALVWHQKHTQFPEPGHTERNVVGSRLWPTYALKSVGLFFLVAAVLTGLGGLVQINPVWLYGPFIPYSAPSPAQPDLYAGWLEGILRLWPNWEFPLFGHTIGELFLPAVVVPGITFTVLALWPFIEARAKRDTAVHHDAQRPRDEPVRAGIGAGGIAFFVLLMLAGSNDVLAKYLQVEVDTLNGVLRLLLFVVPVVAGVITWWVCRDLRARGAAPIVRPGRTEFRRNAGGGFDEVHDADTPPEAERGEPAATAPGDGATP